MYAPLITAAQLKARLDDPDDTLFVLDIREPIEWMREGIIEGAVTIPMNDLPFQLDVLPQDRDIVVYCHLGQRSAVTAAWLLQNGFDQVYDLSGGTESWLHAKNNLTPLPITEETQSMMNRQLLSPTEVNEQINRADENVVLLDIRDAHEYAIDGYILGSTRIPMSQLTTRVSELDKKAQIIVYCRTGGRSARVATWLRQQGFSNIADLDGGVQAWERANLPTKYD